MKSIPILLTGILTLSWCTASYADEASESRMRDMLRQTVLQQRAAQDENTALKIQLEALKAQVSQQSAKPAAPALAKADEKLKQRVSQLEQTVDQLNGQLAQVKQQSASLKASADQLPATQQLLRQSQAEKSQLETACRTQLSAQQEKSAQMETQLQALSQQLASSEQKNQSLVKISQELVTRYKQKGVFSALRDQEPLTGLSRVKLEALAQEYESKIRDQVQNPQQPTVPANNRSHE